MTIRPHLSLRSFWIGFFWSSRYRKLYVLPIPCVGVVISFKKRPWWWFLSTLLLALAGCTTAVDPGGSGGHESIIPSCNDRGTGADTACTAVIQRLESYGCTFAAACDVSCPADPHHVEAICTDDIARCEEAAAQTLPGLAPSELAGACQSVHDYCNSVLLCRPLN